MVLDKKSQIIAICFVKSIWLYQKLTFPVCEYLLKEFVIVVKFSLNQVNCISKVTVWSLTYWLLHKSDLSVLCLLICEQY